MIFKIDKADDSLAPYFEDCPILVEEIEGRTYWQRTFEVDINTFDELIKLLNWSLTADGGGGLVLLRDSGGQYTITVYNSWIE